MLVYGLTKNGSLVVLIGVELAHDVWSGKMVVRLLDHVVALSDLSLLKRALEDVNLSVVFQIHFYFLYLQIKILHKIPKRLV